MANIKAMRKAAGLSQGKLAKLLGVTQGAVSQWEAGKTHPGYKVLKNLTDVLGITLEELYSEDNNATNCCDD